MGALPIFGEKLSVRLAGIDTPEIRGKCAKEKALAIKARDYVRTRLKEAEQVRLVDYKRGKYFRLVATVLYGFDETNLNQELINQGLARTYHGKTKRLGWC